MSNNPMNNNRALLAAFVVVLAVAVMPAPASALTADVCLENDAFARKVLDYGGDVDLQWNGDLDAELKPLDVNVKALECDNETQCDGVDDPDVCRTCYGADPPEAYCGDPDPCTFDDPDESEYCLYEHCQAHPEDTERCDGTYRECSNGFLGRDTDGDTYCDDVDDDDDGDGVPDESDPTPRTNDPVWDAYSCVSYVLTDREVCQPE